MKKYLFAYAVLATALLFFTCRHYRAENRRLVENQTALAADVTRYRTRLGAEAASVQALRLRCGEFETLRAAEQREFDRWAAEAENRRFYNNLTRVWREIQQRAAAYEPDRDRLWRQLQQRIGTYEIPHADQLPKRRRSHLLQMAIAVAAAVAVTLFATRADLFRSAAETAEQRLCAFEGKSQARLSDGSTVWLHGGSTLTCDARFAAGERRVKLRGEGFFEVAKDSERPFTVEVEGLEISVHGTKFNVRTAADRYVSVSLVEGSVSLDTGRGSRRLLRPGEIACYDPDTRKMVIGRGNVAMESCWAAGKLAFERQSLGEICRYMARWYDTEIHITPALAHNYAYTFTITNEPLEEILRIMSRINPIAYTFAEDNTVTISELE